jgi:hypothetical protein
MLFILADVYRIATFRAVEAPRDGRQTPSVDKNRQRKWLRLAGLLR